MIYQPRWHTNIRGIREYLDEMLNDQYDSGFVYLIGDIEYMRVAATCCLQILENSPRKLMPRHCPEFRRNALNFIETVLPQMSMEFIRRYRRLITSEKK